MGFDIGSVFGIFGDFVQGAGAEYQGEENAQIAEYNAQVADQNATSIRQQGDELARRSLVNSRKLIGAAEADYGSSGVGGVSAQMVLRNSAAQGALDALTIKHNADIKATALGNEANLDRFRANADRVAGDLGLATGLLKGTGEGASLFAGE